MRAYYATYNHVRVFVLGVPEGWLVSVYDMQNRQWFDRGDCITDTLREAKSSAQAKAADLTGEKVRELKWH